LQAFNFPKTADDKKLFVAKINAENAEVFKHFYSLQKHLRNIVKKVSIKYFKITTE